jgi:hypothetical protein
MSRLLKQTRQRVNKVLTLVQSLAEDDFPHTDSEDTLRFVESQFLEIRETLEHLDPGLHDQHTIRANCRSALDAVFEYLPVLGFVARSTDVVGALELHRPLHRIVKRAVGSDAHLLLTSDWEYSPYTYLHHRLIQEGFVLVGLPASEAGNGLIVPLAGHEIGHNVWHANELNAHFDPIVTTALIADIKGPRFKEFVGHFGPIDPSQIDDLIGRPIWSPAYVWTMSQCQELFCDFVGLLLFRESYLHAFEYLLSPGGGARDPNYPSMRSRARHLLNAARRRGIPLEDGYVDSFDEELSDATEKDAFLLLLSDAAREALVDQLMSMAEQKLAHCECDAHSDEEKRRVVSAFTRGSPVSGGVKLLNLVNAAWAIEADGIHIWDQEYPQLAKNPDERARVLNELFLKSLEVLEIEQLQEGLKSAGS